MDAVLDVPFSVLRVPNIKLKLPRLALPSANLVFFIVVASYALVISGIVYDMVMEPPNVGQEFDSRGNRRPVAIMKGRVNGQYVAEGLAAGMCASSVALGFILLHWAQHKNSKDSYRTAYVVIGAFLILLGYNLVNVFIRMKVPNYQRW